MCLYIFMNFTVYYTRTNRFGTKNFKVVFGARIYQSSTGEHIVDVQYGYEHHTTEHFEDFASVLPGKKYKILHQTLPKKGDVIIHEPSGRKFVLGEDMDGFIIHKFPMLENGHVVAYLRAEEYYKD